MSGKRVTVTAEIPEELLPDWRLFVVLHGGKVVTTRKNVEVEDERRTVEGIEDH